ncbi:MAG: hypothetical protein KAI81_07310, partial [Candidatus Marinimicrobia bacterium]|nr:hypothetical protein [Candidatus Neomarinimicrobiota bacterium]
MASYSVGRLQKDLREGQTIFGFMATNTYRDLNGSGMENIMHDHATSAGVDFSHEFNDRNYKIYTAISFSEVQGSVEAITQTQSGPGHYFQRPDTDYIEVDTTANSLRGYTSIIGLRKQKGAWRYGMGFSSVSPGYEINDLGFNSRADDMDQWSWASYRDTEPGKLFRNYQINLNQWSSWNFGGDRGNRGGNVNANARFNNNYFIFGGLGINPSGLNFDHLRGGPAIATSFGANMWYGFNSDDRKDFSFGYFGFTYYSLDKVFSSNISPYISFRPRKNIQFSLNPEYKYFDDTWAWVSSFEDSKNEKHYIFSDILQKTFSLTMRLNVTLRTNLSVQFYAAPFLTAGHYENFREIDELREVDFDKRFSAYNDIQLKENQEVIYDDGSSESVDFAVDYNSDGIFDHTFSNPDFNYK